jgi:hypothetical protein
MSITRQRERDETGVFDVVVVVVTVRAFRMKRHGFEEMPPCAGMIQIRFDGRSFDQLPLSPASPDSRVRFRY